MPLKTKIIVAGPRGKMGIEAIHMIKDEPAFQLVACLDRKNKGKSISDIIPSCKGLNIPIFTDSEECFQSIRADVLVDLTEADAGYRHAKCAIHHHIHPVVGTSGITDEQLMELE